MALIRYHPTMLTHEFEASIAVGFRALVGSNYEARRSIAHFLAVLLSSWLDSMIKSNRTGTKVMQVEEVLRYLGAGFLRGNTRCLKPGVSEQSSSSSSSTSSQREIRMGITYVSANSLKESIPSMISLVRRTLNGYACSGQRGSERIILCSSIIC